MKTRILLSISFAVVTAFAFQPASAQQWVVERKDQTRPDPNERIQPATYSMVSAQPNEGYNEIRFTPAGNNEASGYVVEYSIDGLEFQRAGEVVSSPNVSSYSVKHYTQSNEPLLYRISSRDAAGRMSYSKNFMIDGTPAPPLRIIPNTTNQQVLNVNSGWPLYRVNIFSLDGTQLLARDLSGQRDFIPVALPQLSKGMYVVQFTGDGWKHSEKFLVP